MSDTSKPHNRRNHDRRSNSRSRSGHAQERERGRYSYEEEYERKRSKGDSRSPDEKYTNGQSGKPFKKIRYNVPMLDGPLVNFRQFMELQTDRVDTHKAESCYQYYKKQWERRQNEIFYKEHGEEAWFKEKYDPFISEQIQTERQLEVQNIAGTFFQDFQNNVFESLCLEISEEKIAEIQTIETNEEQPQEGETDVKSGVAHQRIILKENFDVSQAPFFGFDPIQRTLFIKTIPKEQGRQEIIETIQKVPGFQSLSLSEPVPNQMFSRYGWVTFETEEQSNFASEKFKTDILVINKYEFNIVKNNQKRMVKVAQKIDLKKSHTDFEQVVKLIASFDSTRGIIDNPILVSFSEGFSYKNLDIGLLYLRRVHSYCYYSGVHCNDERMLTSKCGSVHLRLKTSTAGEEEERWELPNWQNKVQEISNQKILDLEAQKTLLKGVALFKEQLAAKISHKVQKQMKCENGAWPCFYCQKKFKGAEFVVKHIDNKHVEEEKYQEELQKVRAGTTLELYSQDKNRITHTIPQVKDGHTYSSFSNRNRGKFQNNNFNNNSNNNNREKRYVPRKSHGHGGQFKDLDEPEVQNDTFKSFSSNAAINYLEI